MLSILAQFISDENLTLVQTDLPVVARLEKSSSFTEEESAARCRSPFGARRARWIEMLHLSCHVPNHVQKDSIVNPRGRRFCFALRFVEPFTRSPSCVKCTKYKLAKNCELRRQVTIRVSETYFAIYCPRSETITFALITGDSWWG